VCLDTFPWNGHMTTLDSLWMGVLVLTLTGERRAARMGACILDALGMEGFVASSREDFVSKAVSLDADRSGLATLRAGLRERVGNSSLADGVGLAHALEAAYAAMHEAALHAKT
jgi:predicted O-linked N-acetylglucosamine transferase (SPINDLY family)